MRNNEETILGFFVDSDIKSIVLEIPGSIVAQLKFPPKRAQRMLMEELVLRLYEQGILTAAHGSVLLNMDRLTFERFLATHEIPIHGEPEELAADIMNVERVVEREVEREI